MRNVNYHRRETGTPRYGASDFMAVVHVLGGSANVIGYYRGVKIKFAIDIFADFAMVHSPAFEVATGEQYVQERAYSFGNCGNIQSVLCKEGYYYGYGKTGRASVAVQMGRVEIGVSGQATNFNEINWRSRFETNVAPFSATDVIAMFRGWVAVSLTRKFKIEVGVEKDLHHSYFVDPNTSPTRRDIRDTIKYGRVVWAFDSN